MSDPLSTATKLQAVYESGHPLDDAWTYFDPEGDPNNLEMLRAVASSEVEARIQLSRQLLLKALRNGDLRAIGVISITIGGGKVLSQVQSSACRMHHVLDWKRGHIRDGSKLLKSVVVEITGPAVQSPQQAHDLLDELVLTGGEDILRTYAKEHSDWDGKLKIATVDKLNGLMVELYGGAPHFRLGVDRKSWSNYKANLRELMERSGNTDFPLWMKKGR